MVKKRISKKTNDTFVVIGLVLVFLSILFLSSFFINIERDASLFTLIRNLFGYSTIFTTFFLFNLGLKFIGIKYPLNSLSSIIAQFFLLFLIPATLLSFSVGDREILRETEEAFQSGGYVGYFIIVNIFGETFPINPLIRLLVFIGVILLSPVALSIGINKIIQTITRIGKILLNLFVELNNQEDSNKKGDHNVEDLEASTFGDFNKYIKYKDNQKEVKNDISQIEKEERSKSKEYSKPDLGVDVTEVSIGEKGLNLDSTRYPNWKLPPLSLLIPFKKSNKNEPMIVQNSKVIEQTLMSFGIEAKVVETYVGPSIVQYALNLPLGTKVEKVINLSANLALALGVDSKAIRIDSIIDTTYLGIEVPRTTREMVRIKEIMGSSIMQNSNYILPVPIGIDITGNYLIADIQKMPHLLIAGATGSGKSVLTNGFITSLIMNKTPDELRLILIDPKQVEFMDYNGIAHLLHPVITEMDKAVNALKWAVKEMEKRYSILAEHQVRNIEGYNKKLGFSAMPYIVIVIDEMADMMMTTNKVDSEVAIVRLAQKARAVGIHLVLATQRPSVNVITGIIKANIPGRIAMSVTSSTDSRVIIDRIGAESLMGKGDLLYKAPDKTKALRLQCANVEQEEIIRVVEFIKQQAPEVEYIPEITEKQGNNGLDESTSDENNLLISNNSLLEQAIRIVVQSKKGSSSYLQRRLGIGFNRAANLLDQLEELGVVGPANGSKPREVLVHDADQFIADLKQTKSFY